MAGPWEKYGGQQPQGQGPWEKYGGSAPAPDAAWQQAQPTMPKAPIPAALQQKPNLADLVRQGGAGDVLGATAQPYIQSAEIVGGMGAGPANLATGVRGVGRAAGLAEKLFNPVGRLARTGEAIEGMSGSLASQIGKSVPTLPEVPLRERMAQQALQGERVAQRFGRATSGRSTGARPPRPDLIEQMGGKPVEDVANSDAAVKERMESSPEVTYGKYAKAHQGKGSRTYPEPDYFQEQGPNRAPWGGNFPHQ